MTDRSRRPPSAEERSRALAEVEFLAWLLDDSIRVPGTGGRRFGLDAMIGFIPIAGDLFGGLLALVVVWRASRMGLPRVVLIRMLLNSAIDIVIGLIPVIGDAFDLWFKVNVRNLALARRHLAHPDASTRHEWIVLVGLLAVVLGVMLAIGWTIVALLTAVSRLLA